MTRSQNSQNSKIGQLILVATPIGNLGDVSPRAKAVLAEADVIACEDTRRAGRLLSLIGVPAAGRLTSYHDHNAHKVRPALIDKLRNGAKIALISDAGTPLISDPGYGLVAACHDEGLEVVTTPGPCAAIAALSTSGLPTDRFLFAGFVPAGEAAARAAISEWANLPMSTIWYESPKRICKTLKLMAECLGGRRAAVGRELTKLHEETIRATLEELSVHFEPSERQRGECVIVIEGAPDQEISDDDLSDALRSALETLSLRDAVRHVAAMTGQKKQHIYDLALSLKPNCDI